jgi:hypothetical protein
LGLKHSFECMRYAEAYASICRIPLERLSFKP